MLRPCTPHMPPGKSPHVPHVYWRLPSRSHFTIFDVPRSAAQMLREPSMMIRWTSEGGSPTLHCRTNLPLSSNTWMRRLLRSLTETRCSIGAAATPCPLLEEAGLVSTCPRGASPLL